MVNVLYFRKGTVFSLLPWSLSGTQENLNIPSCRPPAPRSHYMTCRESTTYFTHLKRVLTDSVIRSNVCVLEPSITYLCSFRQRFYRPFKDLVLTQASAAAARAMRCRKPNLLSVAESSTSHGSEECTYERQVHNPNL